MLVAKLKGNGVAYSMLTILFQLQIRHRQTKTLQIISINKSNTYKPLSTTMVMRMSPDEPEMVTVDAGLALGVSRALVQ